MEIDKSFLEQIDKVQISERLKREREEYFAHDVKIASARSVLAMETWQETEGDVLDIRWAKLVQKWSERLPIAIFKNQLAVGSETGFFRGADPFVEVEPTDMLEVMETGRQMRTSAAVVSKCEEEDWQAVTEALNFFLGKTTSDVLYKSMRFMFGDWPDDLHKARGWRKERYLLLPTTPMWEKLLGKGLRNIINEAEVSIKRVRDGEESDALKGWFWQAAIICCQAGIHISRRYSGLARDLASHADNPVRRRELEQIADCCEHVPEHPARTLLEAIQSRIMWGIVLRWCCPDLVGDESGRVDQIFYPYFIKDFREHLITIEEACDLMGALLSNVARRDGVKALSWGQSTQGTLISNLTLGGLTREGKDANNELTYLVLHMEGLLKYAEPHYTFRLNTGTPRWAIIKALDTNRKVGGGQPQFMSDDCAIDYFVKQGEELANAREWMGVSCSSGIAGGDQSVRGLLRIVGHPNAPLLLDLALHNGSALLSERKVGIETGDPRNFQSFDQLWQAYSKQMEFLVRRLNILAHMTYGLDGERQRLPAWSILSPGCMEYGQDLLIEGSRPKEVWEWRDRGHVDVADSLMAIKTLVFDQKKLTMNELMTALDSNFAGDKGEEIRRMCLSAPKYGNGIEEVDKLVGASGKLMAEFIHRYKSPNGRPYAINRYGVAWHYYGGKGVGALPNGRKAGEPLDDGSLSPMRGTDRKGVTSVLRSALTAGFQEARASVLNQKFPLSLMQTLETIDKLASLTQTFLTSGGSHIQYNIVDQQMLLDAKKHPEQYKDLVVRIGGYSAYWVQLTPEIQDDIIARSQQSL
ncbi:pyruvate formate lyase family protein [Chloroflexota bacterium]